MGLTAVMRDNNSDDQDNYKAKLLEELLVSVTDGLFPLQDICKAIHILSIFYPDNKKCKEVADKLWFGLIDNSKDMTPEEIVAVFTPLPHLTRSRNMILKVLEEKAVECWQQFKTKDVVEILRVLQQLKYDLIAVSRQQLKLFDTTMKLECRGYAGPFLPKDKNYRHMNIDSRIMRTSSKLMD